MTFPQEGEGMGLWIVKAFEVSKYLVGFRGVGVAWAGMGVGVCVGVFEEASLGLPCGFSGEAPREIVTEKQRITEKRERRVRVILL